MSLFRLDTSILPGASASGELADLLEAEWSAARPGEPVVRRPLGTADMVTKEPVQAAYERSDWCVVPAAGVIGEAMVALVLADAFLQKFGGDSLVEMKRNFDNYARQIDEF